MERRSKRSDLRFAEKQLDYDSNLPQGDSSYSRRNPSGVRMSDTNLDQATEIIAERDGLKVVQLTLSLPKLRMLWETTSRFRTLFSDLTRGNISNFLHFLTLKGSIWLEIQNEQGASVGIICCSGLEQVTDLEAHVIFFDRDLASKVPLCKDVVQWLFATFPIQRITVHVPVMYYATVRLVRSIGFVREGEKRQAILIGGRWVNVYIFGLTRQEAVTL